MADEVKDKKNWKENPAIVAALTAAAVCVVFLFCGPCCRYVDGIRRDIRDIRHYRQQDDADWDEDGWETEDGDGSSIRYRNGKIDVNLRGEKKNAVGR